MTGEPERDAGPCSACGTPTAAGARFCVGCGGILGTAGIVHDSRSARRWIGVVAAVAAVSLGAWAVAGAGGASEDEDESASGRTDGDRPPVTESVDEDASVDDTIDRANDRANDRAVERPTPTVVVTVVPGDGTPLLGEAVGLSLIVGAANEDLQVIDLDTGTVTTSHTVSGAPVLVSGPWLLLQGDGDPGRVSSMTVVPVDELDAAPRRLFLHSPDWISAVAPAQPGTVWARVHTLDGATWWRLVSLEDGATLEERPTAALPVYVPGVWTGPVDVVSSPAGGVFVWTGAGYDRVADDLVVAASEDLLLTQICERPDRCRYRWLDRATGGEVERPVPDDLDAGTLALQPPYLSPGGRVLAYFGSRGPQLFDVDRNQVSQFLVSAVSGLTASPDGRFMAGSNGSAVQVYDADTGASFTVDTSNSPFNQAVFATLVNS